MRLLHQNTGGSTGNSGRRAVSAEGLQSKGSHKRNVVFAHTCINYEAALNVCLEVKGSPPDEPVAPLRKGLVGIYWILSDQTGQTAGQLPQHVVPKTAKKSKKDPAAWIVGAKNCGAARLVSP